VANPFILPGGRGWRAGKARIESPRSGPRRALPGQVAGKSEGNWQCHIHPNIENVDWEVNVDDMMTVIRKKCKRAYPGDYLLLVHARNYGKEINFDRVIEEMKSVQSPFLEVWVIAVVGLDDIKVVRVSPGLPVVDLKVRAELEKASKQVPFLKRGSRGREPGFYDVGTVFLALPRCH